MASQSPSLMEEPNRVESVSVNPETPRTTPRKPIHCLCLDAGPLIKNDPSVSSLIAQADELYMLPSILAEIRDASTRSRVETTLLPFVKLRNPRPESIKFVSGFARRTGDLEVLSRPDLHLLALAYELEVERNGGDWRLRRDPGQRGINGKSPKSGDTTAKEISENESSTGVEANNNGVEAGEGTQGTDGGKEEGAANPREDADTETLVSDMHKLDVVDEADSHQEETTLIEEHVDDASEDSDSEDGWITPSNLKQHQAKDSAPRSPTTTALAIQVGLLTTDFAMQNVALRIGINVLSSSMSRITQLKTWVLRCHGCFHICKKMDRQFCPSCGQATLIRTSCSTDDSGNFKIYLKKNFQWKNRGNVYSVPKPIHGSASGKLSKDAGGGKNGWGRNLIFAEDQKEYSKAVETKRRTKQRDLMDEDYLPSILSGDRPNENGRVRVGAGKNINASRRRG